MQGCGRVCRVGGSDHIDGLVSAQPGQQMRQLGCVEPVYRRRRGCQLNHVPAGGGQMEFGPIHDDRVEPVSKPAKSHPPQQRAGTHVDRDHLQPSAGSGHHDHIGDPRQPMTGKIDNLGVQDISREQQFSILQGGIWRRGVCREPHSVDRKSHLFVVVSTHKSPRQEIADATTAANTKPVNGRVLDVVQDCPIDDPADLDTVSAVDRPP
jgi:hypothetical protein